MISHGDLYRLVGSVSNLSVRYCSPKSSRPINLFLFMTPVCFSRFFVRPITKVCKRTLGLVFFHLHHKTDVAFLFFFFFWKRGALVPALWRYELFCCYLCYVSAQNEHLCRAIRFLFFTALCVFMCLPFEPPNFDDKWHAELYFFFTLHGVLSGLLPCVGGKFADVLASWGTRCALLQFVRL